MTPTMVCRSSLARLVTPTTHQLAALQYSHLAGARPTLPTLWSRPLNNLRPRNHHAEANNLSSARSREGSVASSSAVTLDANENLLRDRPPAVIPEEPHPSPKSTTQRQISKEEREASRLPLDAASPQVAARPPKPPKLEKPKPRLVGRKAALTLTPSAVSRIRALLSGPHPQLIRIGVRNKGCAGMSYHLEYVEKPGTFDEIVEQEGVRVLIDSKALFSIIGSEMDWVEDRLSSKFAFKNPNVKDACGCGESFNI